MTQKQVALLNKKNFIVKKKPAETIRPLIMQLQYEGSEEQLRYVSVVSHADVEGACIASRSLICPDMQCPANSE